MWIRWDKREDGAFIVFCFLFLVDQIAYSHEILGDLQRGLRTEMVKEKEIDYKKCMVGFAIWVDKTKDTKGGFDKKLNEGLMFMQTGAALKPIKEKGDFPKFQVTSRSYFCVPSPQAFDNINADAGQRTKGSTVMGFTNNPKRCVKEAAGTCGRWDAIYSTRNARGWIPCHCCFLLVYPTQSKRK